MNNQKGQVRPSGRAYSSTNNERKTKASGKIDLAFEILSLKTEENHLICPNPECHTTNAKKIVVKTSSETGRKYWKCHKCSATGDALELMTKYGNYSFGDAIKTLLGEGEIKVVERPETNVPVAPAFIAKVDIEVYNEILALGSFEDSVKYYSQWHIDAHAVAEAGSTTIIDAKAVQSILLKKYGRDRLFECGVMMLDKNGNDFFLINSSYNVIEPHRTPSGDVVGLQFRPSISQLPRVQAHKEWKKRWSNIVGEDGKIMDPSDAWEKFKKINPEVAGDKVPYVTPFLSIKGASTDSLVGCGLYRVAALQPGTKVFIVEGFKDLLAARTMGIEAYAIPGTGVMPPKKACSILGKFDLQILLDGDKAGDKGRENLLKYFQNEGIASSLAPKLKNNYDVTDFLVSKFAEKGCTCSACKALKA